MKCTLVIKVLALIVIGRATADKAEEPDKQQLKEKIYQSFKAMYVHLSYVTKYMAIRAEEITRERPSLSEHTDALKKASEELDNILGLDPSNDILFRMTSLETKDAEIKVDETKLRDLTKVENDIKKALGVMPKVIKIWHSQFAEVFGYMMRHLNMEKNANAYRVLFVDVVMIFFPVAREVYRVYGVKPKKVQPVELYVKDIYIKGQKAYVDVEHYQGEGGPGIVAVAAKGYRGDSDLLGRMFMDIESHVKDCPGEIKTLHNVFKHYRSTLNSFL